MNILDSMRQTLMVPIHPAGWPLIALFAAVGLVLALLEGALFAPALALTVWCVYFFRNPVRVTPQRDGLVVSPADGRVVGVEELPPPEEIDLPGGKHIRVSVFMDAFDVHVNRAPVSGVVTDKFYFPGAFLNASLDKASSENERLGLVLEAGGGRRIGVVQIAGLLARRIVCEAMEGDRLEAGEQYGIIRFGSRVDVWLPKPVRTAVLEGQRVLAGETVLADYGRGAKAVAEGRAR